VKSSKITDVNTDVHVKSYCREQRVYALQSKNKTKRHCLRDYHLLIQFSNLVFNLESHMNQTRQQGFGYTSVFQFSLTFFGWNLLTFQWSHKKMLTYFSTPSRPLLRHVKIATPYCTKGFNFKVHTAEIIELELLPHGTFREFRRPKYKFRPYFTRDYRPPSSSFQAMLLHLGNVVPSFLVE